MKRVLGLVLAGLIGVGTLFSGVGISFDQSQVFAETNGVEINETNFPDEAFRSIVLEQADENSNRILEEEEREKIIGIKYNDNLNDSTKFVGESEDTFIYFNDWVYNFKGIEYFNNLKFFWLDANFHIEMRNL